MWKVKQIFEADYGCEERMPGEPLKVLVYLENEFGTQYQLEVEDEWLTEKGINEGDIWPELLQCDMLEDKLEDSSIEKQADWMEEYMNALEDMES